MASKIPPSHEALRRFDAEHLTLCDLALSSAMYDSLLPYNDSLRSLRKATENRIDLDNPDHCAHLVKWLNDWGCRHLSKAHRETTARAILGWHRQARKRLFQQTKTVCELDDHDLSEAVEAYGSLKDRVVAQRDRGAETSDVHMGPTAASKVLFALRPKALMPWDEAMRIGFGCDGTSGSYSRFLQCIREIAWKIRDLCNENGFEITELPLQIERPGSTVIELINQYIWVTVTRNSRNCRLPSASTLARWASWGRSSSRNK